VDDFASEAFGVWPDNIPAVNALIALSSQWRPEGAGLDYTAIPVVFRMIGLPRAEWPDTFECLRVLESEVRKMRSEQK